MSENENEKEENQIAKMRMPGRDRKQENAEGTAAGTSKGKKFNWIFLVRIILVALILCVPGVIHIVKGDSFDKGVREVKKQASFIYEQPYRKYIFPQLSSAFTPKWVEEERIRQEELAKEAKAKENESKEENKKDEKKTVDILEGVPQVPAGLDYFPAYSENQVIFGRDNWLFSADGTSVDYYIGNNVLSDSEMADYCNRLETLGNICKRRGIEVVMMVGPNKEQVFPEYYPSVEIVNNYKRLITLEQYMQKNCSVPFLYPVRELAENKDEYQTYWKYDTHWNSTGAYVGMKAIYKALGRPIKKDDNIIRSTEETIRGDMSGVAGYYEPYLDYITEYKPEITYDTEIFNEEWDIDYYGKVYTSTANTNKKLVVVGDSFRLELSKHMCKDYKKTTLFHREIIYTDRAIESLNELGKGDTLVIVCVERWDYRMFDALNDLISVMQ